MAWKNVLVKEGGKEIPAVMQGDMLELPNFLGCLLYTSDAADE